MTFSNSHTREQAARPGSAPPSVTLGPLSVLLQSPEEGEQDHHSDDHRNPYEDRDLLQGAGDQKDTTADASKHPSANRHDADLASFALLHCPASKSTRIEKDRNKTPTTK